VFGDTTIEHPDAFVATIPMRELTARFALATSVLKT
jgi:hypothetical protein